MAQRVDYGEQVFGAIETIAKSIIQQINYDKTILCSIVSVDDNKGSYTVLSGTMQFTAVGETGFKVGNNVYVLLPEGSYTNARIVGRYVSDDTQVYNYVSPMDNFLQLTNNLCPSNITGELIANNEYDIDIATLTTQEEINAHKACSEILLHTITENDLRNNTNLGFNRLGISADFKTALSAYSVISGNYGLRLHVTCTEKSGSTNNEQSYENDIYLDITDMWGNPYNYGTYFTQEKVFDISKVNIITKIEIYFYQLQNFIDANNLPIPYSTTLGTGESKILFNPNIFVQNIIISFGHSLDDIKEDTIYLYTNDSLEYNQATAVNNTHTSGTISTSVSPTGNDKNIYLRWIHQIDENTFKAIDADNELPNNCYIHWYRYRLDKDVTDELAGMFWEEITPSNNKKLNVIFTPDETEQEEELKVIIVEINQDELNSINTTYPDSGANSKVYLLNLINNYKITLEQKELKKLEYDNILEAGNPVEANTYTAIENEIRALKKSIKDTQELYDTFDTNKANAIRTQAMKLYESDILTFKNTDTVANKATVDLVRGLQIKCLDSFNGVYKIYDPLSGFLTNLTEGSKTRKAQVSFTSILTGTAELDKAEKIKWYIPKYNTMIQAPVDGIEYSLDDGDIFDNTDDEYYIITRKFGGELVEELSGKTVDRSAVQYYRIEKYFNENKNDNTIKCEVIRNTISYTTEKDLVFGLSGSNGRDATLVLGIGNDYDTNNVLLEKNAPAWTFEATTYYNEDKTTYQIAATNSLELKAQVFNYNNEPLTITQLTWSYYVPTADADKPFTINANNRLTLNSGVTLANFKGCVLKCTAYAGGKQYTGYLSIPVRKNRLYKYLEGATSVIYNSQGASPSYYKEQYKLYNNNEILFGGISVKREDSWLSTAQQKWLPTVRTQNSNYYIMPNTLFVDNIEYCCVFGVYMDSVCVWKQPILIIENRYSSPMLNNWDGSLTMDKENGTILSAMIGAGKKNSDDNTFSGVLIGDVKIADESIGKTGVYGYDHGEMSYGLKEDGTSFLGKASTARLVFDGKTGTIYNQGYANGTGIKLYLDGVSANEQYLSLKSAITGTSYEYVRLSTKGPFLSIKGSDGKDRFVVNNDKTTIAGWTVTDTTISKGSTTLSADGYIVTSDLYADGGKIGGWTIGSSTLKGGDTTLSSDGTITCSNLIATTAGKIGPYTITSDGLWGNNFSLSKTSLTINGSVITANATGGITIGGDVYATKYTVGGNRVNANYIVAYEWFAVSSGGYIRQLDYDDFWSLRQLINLYNDGKIATTDKLNFASSSHTHTFSGKLSDGTVSGTTSTPK